MANLKTSGRPADQDLDMLLNYLNGTFIIKDKHLCNTTANISLLHLRTALKKGRGEIEQGDDKLEDIIKQARSPQYGQKFDDDELYATRIIDWDDLDDDEIDRMGREDAVAYLKSAKEEIRWVRNECDRLLLHMCNAAEQIAEGWRESFAYHPFKRDHE